jgi:quinone-modifying oxidoreductase, subunit QmoC
METLQTTKMTTSAVNSAASTRYHNNFLKEVEANVEDGLWVKMCMQCGVCAGSCPLGPHWEHTPQKIFMMIRAGQRDQVLKSDSMWMCTSCYNCMTRCPRKLPITHIMHGLAAYAHQLGLAREKQSTRLFSVQFWNNCVKTGRLNELKLTMGLYFKDGLMAGIKQAWVMRDIGRGMMLAQRLNPFELFGGHRCKGQSGITAMLKKAREIEHQNHQAAN